MDSGFTSSRFTSNHDNLQTNRSSAHLDRSLWDCDLRQLFPKAGVEHLPTRTLGPLPGTPFNRLGNIRPVGKEAL